jgi:DNA polymerase/3'-5' exonuclease PolX
MDHLQARSDELSAAGAIQHLGRWGPRAKTFRLGGVTFDLYACPREQWGCQLAIRTGPAAFSRRLVTTRAKGALCPDDLKFDQGRLWQQVGAEPYQPGAEGWEALETPEESDVFRALGLAYLDPEDRA